MAKGFALGVRYAYCVRRKRRRPGPIPGKNPGPSEELVRLEARGHCLYALIARRCPVGRRGDEGDRGDVSALQLRALRGAGAHLPVLRPGQPLLCGGVRADSSARVITPRRDALSAKLSRGASARGAPKGLATTAAKESDASGFRRRGGCGHSGARSDRGWDAEQRQ